MNAFAYQCISLRKLDHSLSEIVRITGRPKASVYPYIKNIPLSEKKLVAIRAKNKIHLLRVAALRKGKSTRGFSRFSWNKETVLLVAHLLFDGEIKRTTCSYNNRNRALIKRVEHLMQPVYEFKPKRYKNFITGVTRISYHNVALGAYMQEKSKELLSLASALPKELKREMLRAFFDDEGCMDFRPHRNVRQVRGYQKNISILKIIQLLLLDFNIGSSIKEPNEVVIVGKNDITRFQKEINFSPGIRINGNRSNSIWRKHLEKRDILRRAIASYLQ